MTLRDFALLALAAFAAQLGYGVILPLLPELIERIGGDASVATRVAHTTGLTTTYMLAAFAAALPWGRTADRVGGRRVVLIGLGGHSLALISLTAATDVPTAYLLRAAAGVFASAVLSGVAVTIAGERDQSRRARYFAGSSAAALLGLLAGPALSGMVSGVMARMVHADTGAAMTLAIPYSLAAAIGLACLGAAALGLRSASAAERPVLQQTGWTALATNTPLHSVLVANFLVLFGLGALEVIMPLFGAQRLALDALAVGLLFAACSLVMIAVQGGLFASGWLSRRSRGGPAAVAFIVMAAGFVWFDLAGAFTSAAGAVGVIAAGGGYLLPALGYAASLATAARPGVALGAMTAAGSLGQALGSAAGGSLYGYVGAPALWVLAAAMLVGAACARAARIGATATRNHGHAAIGRAS